MPGLGHNSYLQLAKEAVWGTKVIAGMELVEHTSETIATTFTEKIVQGINSTRVRAKRQRGAKMVGGDVVYEVGPEAWTGHLLKGVLPTEVFTDDGAGNGGVHEFTPGSILPPGLTVQAFRSSQADGSAIAGNVRDYFGGRVSQLSLEAAADELLKGTATVSFKDEEPGVWQDPAGRYDDQLPFVYHSGTFTIDGVPVQVTAMTLAIATGLKTERKELGAQVIKQQQPGLYAITGQVTAYYDDMSLVNKFLQGAPGSIVLDLTGQAIGITTRRIKIELPTVYLNGETPKVSGADSEIMLALPFVAILDGTGVPNEAVKITLANSRRSAY